MDDPISAGPSRTDDSRTSARGVMPLCAVLVRDIFGPRIMGTTFGAVSMFASLGMALGPGAGGFDTHGKLCLALHRLFAIGLSAVAIALTFRPMRFPPTEQQLDLKHA
jgi:MFS family permease